METKNKKLPVGIEMFRDIREHDFYYIDKTGFIKELLEHGIHIIQWILHTVFTVQSEIRW